jgi:phosphoribosylamine--glycine ligase
MAQEGRPYQGFLYVGLMIEAGRPQVLEFNCRLGDPEAQPLMMRLQGDFASFLLGAAQGRLPAGDLQWDPRPSLCVVLTAEGYPGPYRKGDPIEGLEAVQALDDVVVFHAGTEQQKGKVLTSGGRVLGVTAIGTDIPAAQARAYHAVENIRWPGMHYRQDIGARALRRLMGAAGKERAP